VNDASGWSAAGPTGVPMQGNFTSVDLGSGCTVRVVKMGGCCPINTTVFLQKVDTTDGSCNEAKGFKRVGSSYTGDSDVVLATDGYYLAVLFSEKKSAAGNAPTTMHILQVDAATGAIFRTAIDAVDGADVPAVLPSNTPISAQVDGTNLIVQGKGVFVGADPGTSQYFETQFWGFFSDAPADDLKAGVAYPIDPPSP
jgi:hypothetical protein